jgi:hypothetical protein
VQVPPASVVVHSWVVTPLVPQAVGAAQEVMEVGAASGEGEASLPVAPESPVFPPPLLLPLLPLLREPSTPLQPSRASAKAAAARASMRGRRESARLIGQEYARQRRDLPGTFRATLAAVAPRARHGLAAATAAVVLRILVACSTSGTAAPAPEAGPPGEAFSACQIQGYISESEAGLCPDGTCSALAFDTNGARIPCCTSVVSGPGMCVDGAGMSLPDGSEPDATADGGEVPDGDEPVESGPVESGLDSALESGTDGATAADAESGAPEAGPPPDAADGD